MKKFTVLLLVLFFTASIAACSYGQEESESSDASSGSTLSVQEEAANTPDGGNNRILVAYFSWADNAVIEGEVDAVASPSVTAPGHVAQLASWVQEETGGDLFSIRVTEPYSSDWDECLDRANNERSQNVRPELTEAVDNQLLAEETRKAREQQTRILLANLDGWGEEYEQIRQDD